MPLDGGERHELAEAPPQHHNDRENPMPQSGHRVPNFYPVRISQKGLLLFAEIVVAAFAGFTHCANFGLQVS